MSANKKRSNTPRGTSSSNSSSASSSPVVVSPVTTPTNNTPQPPPSSSTTHPPPPPPVPLFAVPASVPTTVASGTSTTNSIPPLIFAPSAPASSPAVPAAPAFSPPTSSSAPHKRSDVYPKFLHNLIDWAKQQPLDDVPYKRLRVDQMVSLKEDIKIVSAQARFDTILNAQSPNVSLSELIACHDFCHQTNRLNDFWNLFSRHLPQMLSAITDKDLDYFFLLKNPELIKRTGMSWDEIISRVDHTFRSLFRERQCVNRARDEHQQAINHNDQLHAFWTKHGDRLFQLRALLDQKDIDFFRAKCANLPIGKQQRLLIDNYNIYYTIAEMQSMLTTP